MKKRKPYRVKVSSSFHVYSETTTGYVQDTTAPYFNPPMEVITCIDHSNPCINGKTRVLYGDPNTGESYYNNNYGYLRREDQYGDTGNSSDDRTIVRSFNPNVNSWIIGLPATETLYSGIGTGGTKVSESLFYYDNAGNYNTSPSIGNLTKIERWLDTANAYPATTMTYDTYGNVLSITDARGHTTSICYDANATFPQATTNALGQQTKTEYYGVSWNMACGAAPSGYGGTGLYGQVKTVTDSNSAQIKTDYDSFGRKSHVSLPDGSWSSIAYNNFGAVGAQHIRTDTASGLTSWSYFDGLGRTIKEKKTGPDSKVIAVETRYNSMGTVYRASLPYFEGIETAKYKTFTYDPLGRQTQITNPDGTVITADYTTPWKVKSVDASGHQRRETRDAYGRLILVEEFTGAAPNPSLYATTTYAYNESGNLKSVMDAKGNKTSMRYDSLGRKMAMSDPDMGGCGDLTILSPNTSFPWYSPPCWSYEYDNNGNLIRQQDAKGQVIWFQYDALNRVRQKDYETQKAIGSGDVVYSYDAGSNGIGRLSQVTDLSGSTAFTYDVMGRTIRTDKVVGSATYTTKSQYDNAGRLSAIAYPDNSDVFSVNYQYNGPVLSRVSDEYSIYYVRYSGYNAMGQPEMATYRNGVTTTFSYNNSGNGTCSQDNYRLCTQQTAKGSTVYQLLRYSYYNVGNVHEIFDDLDSNNTQTFTYDELNRLTSAQSQAYSTISYSYNEIGNMMSNSQMGSYDYPANGIRPHAVSTAGSNTYIYDDNGNMTSGAGRTIRYDYDNRPISVTAGGSTTTFMYDANGNRVKKTANGVSTIYIGKLYENTSDGCVKYIFAGGQRIAMRDATGALFYYHTDHLGSSSVVTNTSGNMVEQLAYFPYGQIRINTGTKDVHHKFTGQELDAETGLYFYGARYYDPQLGRFISADTIIPNPRNPQDLNRYSYVSNNPLNYIDPTGHSWFSKGVDKINKWLDRFFKRNHIQVSAGIEGSVDTNGNVTPQGHNPDTGETFPYMPSSAAEVKTGSTKADETSSTVNYVKLVQSYEESNTVHSSAAGHTYEYSEGKIILLSEEKDGSLYYDALNDSPKEGALTIYAHGTSSTVAGMDANDLAAFINKTQRWTSGEPVILNSCRSGMGENSIAQQLAPQLDTYVTGASERLWQSPFNSQPYPQIIGYGRIGIPNIFQPGEWRTFGPSGPVQ